MENVITISIEEYKDLIRVSLEDEYRKQIDALQEKVKQIEELRSDDCTRLTEDKIYWYKQYCAKGNELESANARIAELEEELSFYKPAQQEQETS